VTENDYANDLANGELGVKIQGEVFFGNRRIPLPLLKAWEYAFCLSVHKSQGSEFDHVILLLPPGSEYFGKRLLYTAVTRARRHLEVWGDREVLKKCLLN
jgi:exodeoxyribonuclease V alpha subunit